MTKELFRDRAAILAEIIRVNHAGEKAAQNIYTAQAKTIKDPEAYKLLNHMLEQERVHLEFFEQEMRKRQIRPTALLPLWNFLSYGIGKVTGLMGKEAAMMCTEAVEEVIDDHYKDQISQLKTLGDEELIQAIEKFRQEEIEHKETAITHGAINSPFYKSLSAMIKFGCRRAIALSKRI
jgi:3-demethoxyubiquinol 3-hydroxylase